MSDRIFRQTAKCRAPRRFAHLLCVWLCTGLLYPCSGFSEIAADVGLQQQFGDAENRLRVSVSDVQVNVADRFRYTLQVEASTDWDVLFEPVGEQYGPFGVVERTPFGPVSSVAGRAQWQREYTLEAPYAGDLELPSLTVSFVRARGECIASSDCINTTRDRQSRRLAPVPDFVIATDAIQITVNSVLPSDVDLSRPMDIAAPRLLTVREEKPDAQRSWRRYGLLAGLGLVAGVLALAWRHHWRQSQRTFDPTNGRLDGYAHTLQAIDQLDADLATQTLANDQYYRQLLLIVRQFLAWQMPSSALSQTNRELLAGVWVDDLEPMQNQWLAEFLGTGDLVNFAQLMPSDEQLHTHTKAARHFVQQIVGARS